MQSILVINDKQLVNADVFGEKLIGHGDGIVPEFPPCDGVNLGAGSECLGNRLRRIAGLHHMARKQTDEFSLCVHDREGTESEFLLLDEFEYVGDVQIGGDLDRILNQSLDVVFHTADLLELLALRHVIVNQPQAAVERHGDCHPGLGHRVHVGGDDRDIQLETIGQSRIKLRQSGEHL